MTKYEAIAEIKRLICMDLELQNGKPDEVNSYASGHRRGVTVGLEWALESIDKVVARERSRECNDDVRGNA